MHYGWYVLIALSLPYLALGTWIASCRCRDVLLYRAQQVFIDGKRPAGVHWEPFLVFLAVLLGWPIAYLFLLERNIPGGRPIRILAIEDSSLIKECLGGKLPHGRWATHLVVFRDDVAFVDSFCLPKNVPTDDVPYSLMFDIRGLSNRSLIDVVRPLARYAHVEVFCTRINPDFLDLRNLIVSHGGNVIFYLPWEGLLRQFEAIGLKATCTKRLDLSRLPQKSLEEYVHQALGCSTRQR